MKLKATHGFSIITLFIALASTSATSELSMADGLKTTPLVPRINTARLLDHNPALKAFFMAPVKADDQSLPNRSGGPAVGTVASVEKKPCGKNPPGVKNLTSKGVKL